MLFFCKRNVNLHFVGKYNRFFQKDIFWHLTFLSDKFQDLSKIYKNKSKAM